MLFQYLVIFVVPALLVLIFWGWRQLWWLFPVWSGIWLFFFLLNLWEGRWGMVTPKDRAWGAPDQCPHCSHGLDIVRRGQRYKVRCPICDYKKDGDFLPASDPQRKRGWDTSMSGVYPKCPRCGNIVSFRKGDMAGLRCKIGACDAGVEGIYVAPIEQDKGEYAVSLRPLGEAWKERSPQLIVRFGLSPDDVERLEGSEEVRVFQGRAPDAFRLRHELQVQGIEVSIEPPFPYDVYDPRPEGEFPATQEEIRSLEEAIQKEKLRRRSL